MQTLPVTMVPRAEGCSLMKALEHLKATDY